ncbi:MAG: hypothetical protein WD960_13375 [Gemmatimonadota bacterium]
MKLTMRGTMAMALLTATVVLGACDDEGVTTVDASMAVVAGSYMAEGNFGAITFTLTEAGSTEVVDLLEAGSSLVIHLREDGTTSGRLFVVGGDDDGSDFDADLTGTWTLQNGIVSFQHEADTFIRDAPFDYDGGVLSSEETFSDATIRVVLQRR